MSNNVLYVNDANFDSLVLQAKLPVLVDFWAEWCMPCKMMSPLMDELAEIYQGRAIIAKLNIEENPAIAMRYQVRAIPLFLVFNKGDVVNTQRGTANKQKFVQMIDSELV